MATPTKIAARASDRLTKSLINTTARGLRPHCADPELAHLWLSDHEEERAVAAILCGGCPVELECRGAAAARRETFGVWGGVDRTRNPNGSSTKLGRPRKITT
jgi:hypothetical protein